MRKIFNNKEIIFLIFIVLLLLSIKYGKESRSIGAIFFYGMLFVSLMAIILRYFSDKKLLKEIGFLTKHVSGSKDNMSKSDFNNLQDSLNGKLDKLKDIWDSFTGSLYKTSDKVIQTIDAEYFFNNDTLIKDRMYYKLLNYIPQSLVGLGLLGTFLGLTMGLSDINLADKATINNSITTLIKGTRVSFSTSLYGMYFSIIFSFFINFYIGFYEKKIIELKNKLNLIFSKSNEDEKFENLKNKINEIVTSNKDMAENIANKIDSSMLKITDRISESLGGSFQESIGESLEKIFTTDFVKKFENIKDELIEVSMKNHEFINNYSDKINDINIYSEQIKNSYQKLSLKINDINIYSEQIKNSYQKLSLEVSGKFNSLMNKILENYSKMDDNYSDFMDLTKEINSIQKENKEYLTEFQNFSEKSFQITNSLDNFVKAEKNIMNIWEQYKNSFSDLGDKLETNLNDYKNILSTTSNSYRDLIREGVDEYTDKLKKGVFSLFKDYDNNLTKVIEEFNAVINHLSEKLSSSSSVLTQHNEILNKNEKQIARLNILLNKKNIDR